ncbi:2Fe-2S ferredoxin-type domain-containing protein [Panaeolus papilionaceus]|nr:2Fe-2S ferredoxin-type domain-containing protein [Panaeolus papilionaceus]
MFASHTRTLTRTTHTALGCLKHHQHQQRAAFSSLSSLSRYTYAAQQQSQRTKVQQRPLSTSTITSRMGLDRERGRRRAGWMRGMHASSVRMHSGIDRPAPGTGLKVHFKDSNDKLIKTVEANEGDDILAIAHEYDIDLEGACEGSVACSTCHIILPESYYDLLPEPEDDENDMLDMAFGLTDTSRLGCQVVMSKELDGIECRLPSATRNMFVDGKKASH